jgi:hypothetical protein
MMGERRVMQEALFYGFRRTRRRPRTRADRWSRCRRRSIEPPEKATIIVPSAKERPAFVGLALDIGFRRLALGVQRVKVLFEALVGRDPSRYASTKPR